MRKHYEKNQTPAEERLWKILRNHQLEKLKFRRQHPINRFIVDFYCHELKLIIEIDGNIHLLEDVKEYDIEREEQLKALGLTILRFTNENVFVEPEIIIEAILKLIVK